MVHLPRIGITMGDPCGIGPEIIVKALSDPGLYEICRPVVLGDPVVMAAEGEGRLSVRQISAVSEAAGLPGGMDLIPTSRLEKGSVRPGRPTPEAGEAMASAVLRAVEMTMAGDLAAMVTCPISKVLLQEAGFSFEGHTQMIAHLTGATDFVMMLAGERLRVSLVTIHCALKDVPANLDQEKVYRTVRITAGALEKDFGLQDPALAVAALNPHGGESGLFGSEEDRIIRPALERARGEGIRAEGPFPADTLFHRAVSGRYDAVVAMYHDQGLIPLKLLHFSDAVNITLGLPIVRTSVDHGTAYDIAGKDIADSSSLKAAVRAAVTMAQNRAMQGRRRHGRPE